jgi:hypothetical protein
MEGFDTIGFQANVQRLLEATGDFANVNIYRAYIPLAPRYPFLVIAMRSEILSGLIGQTLDLVNIQLGLFYAEKQGTNLVGVRYQKVHEFFYNNPTMNDSGGNPTCESIESIIFEELNQQDVSNLGDGIQGFKATAAVKISYKW